MEPYIRGACIGELESENPTDFDKLQDALELGPEQKEGTLDSLTSYVSSCGGPFAADDDGATALHWAARYDHSAAVGLVKHLLRKQYASADGLRKKQMKAYKEAVDAWEKAQQKDDNGKKNSGKASMEGVEDAQRPPQPSDFTNGIPTPLHEACRYDHHEIAELLLSAGGAISVPPSTSGTISAASSSASAAAAVEGAASNTQNNDKTSDKTKPSIIDDIVQSISTMNSSTAAKALFANKGADPNAKDRDGTTPLHICALWNNTKTAAVILRYGGDPTTPNAQGETALKWAQSYPQIRGLLEEWVAAREGSDVAQTDAK